MSEQEYEEFDFDEATESLPKGDRHYMIEFIDYNEERNGKRKYKQIANKCCEYHASIGFALECMTANRENVEIRRIHTIH